MAGIAAGTKLTIMGIVLGMAGYAFARKCGKVSCVMAFDALQLEMSPCEWEARFGMIKSGRQPGFGSVAGSTASPKLAFMRVICSMARKTIARKCAKAGCGVAL